MNEDSSEQPKSETSDSKHSTASVGPNSENVHIENVKGNNNKLLLLVLLLAVLVGGAIAWKFSIKTKTTEPISSQTKPHVLAPFALAYATETESGEKVDGCGASTLTRLNWVSITGGSPNKSNDLGGNNVVVYFETYKNEAFIVTDPACGSKDGASIWYSSDAGKTYAKLFNGKPFDTKVGSGDQITSAKFSPDGKTIVFGFLPAARNGNTVKEIDLDNKAVKDMFTVNKSGVFIQGYDRKNQQIYYYSGCYNCDGASFDELFVRDIAKDSDSVVFQDAKRIGVKTVFKDDFTKILLVKGAAGEFLGAAKPYSIEEFDLATKTNKALATVDEESPIKIGYREDGSPYYSKGNTVNGFDASGKSSTIFESTKPILDVYYVGKDQVVAAVGEDKGFQVIKFNLSDKTSTKIVNGNPSTHILGVTWY